MALELDAVRVVGSDEKRHRLRRRESEIGERESDLENRADGDHGAAWSAFAPVRDSLLAAPELTGAAADRLPHRKPDTRRREELERELEALREQIDHRPARVEAPVEGVGIEAETHQRPH